MVLNMSGGGPSATLNFKIIGGTEMPINPHENTIWINTEEREIKNWMFSPTAPTEPSNGMVWITTGLNGNVMLNALKKNGIQIYPLTAKQYISDIWVEKSAKIYQGEVWVDWITYLYNCGDDCYTLTGGWESNAYSKFSGKRTAPSLTMDDANMVLSFRDKTGGAVESESIYYVGSVWTKNRIKIKDISTITFVVDSIATGSARGIYLHLASDKKDDYTVAASKSFASAGTHTLDVRGLDGEYYVVFANDHNSDRLTIEISQIFCK